MTAATAIALHHFDRPLQRHSVQHSLHNFTQRPKGHRCSSSNVQSLRPETYDVENSVASATQGRTIPERAPIDNITEREFARVVSNALQAHYGPLKASAKCVANDAGASVDAAKNWLSGLCPPSSIYLKRLERRVPGLAAEMRRLQAMESDFDPDFEREFNDLVRRVQALERA